MFFHLKFSLYTFFFAGLSVASIRYLYFIIKSLPKIDVKEAVSDAGGFIKKGIAVVIITLPFLAFKTINLPRENRNILNDLSFKIPAARNWVQSERGYLLIQRIRAWPMFPMGTFCGRWRLHQRP
ncbi:MAG: hypothetical protein U5L96_06125 [Owenweeksia sp.]|nr:hypothetical protein [Owenweeksia sp.]